jgi:histone acetyltransferase MYST1
MDKIEVNTIEIGDKYLVNPSWPTRESMPDKILGDIIERRLLKKIRDLDVKNDDLDACDYEYYIHYCNEDRRLDEWVSYSQIDINSSINGNFGENRLKRKMRRIDSDSNNLSLKEELETNLAIKEKEHEDTTKLKNVQSIILGQHSITAWYFSPYPDECCTGESLFLCEYCLKYMKKRKSFYRHADECKMKSPPGREIYREADLSMFEVDGSDHKVYCQNLCLLSKLFLDHKTLYYDVDPFLFYILCESDTEGYHIVGYFSKEKQSANQYNLACILTFPPFQRKGYGKFLISLSYELTKRESTTGSPEKPLSDLGKISYRSYWEFTILKLLKNEEDERIEGNRKYVEMKHTVNDIGRKTGIKTEDILSTLHTLNLIKYWKGQHMLCITHGKVNELLRQTKKIRLCNPTCLYWSPPLDKNIKKEQINKG